MRGRNAHMAGGKHVRQKTILFTCVAEGKHAHTAGGMSVPYLLE